MPELFTSDAQIFEKVKAEGSFANYLAHHLKPELAEFASFKFGDVKTTSEVVDDVAVASETYHYSIVLKDGRAIERAGVATAVLVRKNGIWKIKQHHSSSRAPPS